MNKSETITDYKYNKVSITDIIEEKEENPPKYGCGVRHIQLVLFLLCLTVNIITRGHMGVTIVAMTSHLKENIVIVNTTIHGRRRNYTDMDDTRRNITVEDLGNFAEKHKNVEKVALVNTTEKMHKTYNWPKSVQEMVLNSFFLGYAIMMFPMGMLCQRYGGKIPMQIGLFVNGAVSVVTPWLTLWGGWKAVCCCRILQGFSQSGTYPGLQALLAKWAPESERATLSSYVYTGVTVGTVIAFQMSGFLGASKWGWPANFYAIGVLSLICFVLLTMFGASSPMEHKTISVEERNYILGDAKKENNKKVKTPWRAILTSRPVWGAFATHVGSNISFVFFFNQVPTYIHYILGVNVRNSGLLSSLPYVASFFTSLGFGWISDYCTNNNIISKTNTRRIFNSIAQCGIAFCLILTSYTNTTAVAVSCLVVGMAAHMGVHVGWMINHIDLAPNFSGTIMATGNTLGNIFVVLIPIIVSYVVTDTTNIIQWRIVFFIITSISIVCNAIFVMLVSTEIQPWNFAPQEETNVEKAEDLKIEKESKTL